MAARAEMSTNAQGTDAQSSVSPKGMSVALIGPNDAHRQVVARALASGDGRKVHEFIDYPSTLSDLARMMETRFDVVLVDVDTDESYALQIMTKLAELGPAVMAYSARTDEDLVASCMRAGASDFLPLPTENGPAAEAAAPPVARPAAAVPQPAPRPTPPPVQQSVPKPVAAVPQPAPAPTLQPPPKPVAAIPQPAARPLEPRPAPMPTDPWSTNVTSVAPPKFAEPKADPWSSPVVDANPKIEPEKAIDTPAKIEELNILKDDAKSDFAAWDAANLRRASMPPVTKPEPRPARPSLVPEKRKTPEPVTREVPPVEELLKEAASAPPPPPPVIERPPISTDIFRSSTFLSEPSEAAEKQGARWVKWMLIAAGPLVLGLVLLVVFTRSSSPNTAAAASKEAPVPAPSTAAPEQPDPTANERLIVNATGKPGDNNPLNKAKSNLTGEQAATPSSVPAQTPKEVSPDAMAAQLVAPARIAGQIKTKATADEPPPTAPGAVSMEDNSAVPGSLFQSGSKVKVAPHVVPISAGLAAGMLIHKTAPVYPKFAQEAHITGSVVLKATITKQGTIEGIQVLSGPKILAPPAVDAVKTWKYRPYMLDGQPVAVETNVTVVFGPTGH